VGRACARGERGGRGSGAKQEGGWRGLSGAQEQRRGEEKGGEERREKRKRKRGKRKERREKKWEREKRKGKRREQEGKEREGGGVASAPIAAATTVGRPRACVLHALRETIRIAPALIAEKRSRVVVGRRAVRDGTTVKFGVVQKGLGLGF
jgi:hypothetical protein